MLKSKFQRNTIFEKFLSHDRKTTNIKIQKILKLRKK